MARRSTRRSGNRTAGLLLAGAGLVAALVVVPSAGPASATPSCKPATPKVTATSSTNVTVTIPAGTCSRSGSGAPTGFRLYRHDYDGTNESTDVARSATSVNQRIGNGKLSTFRLVAYDATGEGPSSASSIITAPPYSTFGALLDHHYQDYWGRPPTAAEVQQINTGMQSAFSYRTQYDLIWSGTNSAYWGKKQAPVTRLFRAYFGRNPDLGGLTFWSNKSRSGWSINAISSNFAASSEFKRKYGELSNQAFVELVYTSVLGRPGDPSGIASWTAKLDNHVKTRGQVMVGFSESSEFLRRTDALTTTVNVFTGMVRRMPTADETTNWVTMIEGKVSVMQLLQMLYESLEDQDRIS